MSIQYRGPETTVRRAFAQIVRRIPRNSASSARTRWRCPKGPGLLEATYSLLTGVLCFTAKLASWTDIATTHRAREWRLLDTSGSLLLCRVRRPSAMQDQ